MVNICDDEEYEKNAVFYVEIGEPKLIKTAAGKKSSDGPLLGLLVSENL